ncbi:MAG: hypothetical protein Kow00124_27010 [Anaerolineae bacterium]
MAMGNPAGRADLATRQTPVYEIRVRGRLDSAYWAEWYDGVTITSDEVGETILRVPVPDQAALYGLLSRLRDLAVPLISVNVWSGKDRPAPRRGLRLLPINWQLGLLYLLLTGGLVSVTIFFTSEGLVHTALALALLFGALGALAATFSTWDRGWAWRALAGLFVLGALIPLIIYLGVMGWMHPALVVAIPLFLAAAGLMAVLARQRAREPRVVASAPDQGAVAELTARGRDRE